MGAVSPAGSARRPGSSPAGVPAIPTPSGAESRGRSAGAASSGSRKVGRGEAGTPSQTIPHERVYRSVRWASGPLLSRAERPEGGGRGSCPAAAGNTSKREHVWHQSASMTRSTRPEGLLAGPGGTATATVDRVQFSFMFTSLVLFCWWLLTAKRWTTRGGGHRWPAGRPTDAVIFGERSDPRAEGLPPTGDARRHSASVVECSLGHCPQPPQSEL